MEHSLPERIIEEPKPLSSAQKDIVLSEAQYIRVIAGAGTGKTETLIRRILYLLLIKNVEPREIVAFTFTEKAGENMKSRLFLRMKDLVGEDKLSDLSELFIGTIHSFCLAILQDYYGYDDYDVLDDNQEIAFILRHGWDLGLRKYGRHHIQNCKRFHESVNVIYNELIPPHVLEEKDSDFFACFKRYEDLLKKHRFLTFGKIIAIAVEKLKENPEKLKHIKYLLVDEYQDINHAQEELIKLIGQHASVFVVGDPRQCIYQWRGSDVNCFHEFTTHFPEAQTYTLSENRRSVPKIIRVANVCAKKLDDGSYEDILPVRTDQGGSYVIELSTPEDEAEWIINQIQQYVSHGQCRYNDCAILLRSVRTSARPFIHKLEEEDIPYIVGGKVGLFHRPEAKALGMFFSWLWDGGFYRLNHYTSSNSIRGCNLRKVGVSLWEKATDFDLSHSIHSRLDEWRDKVLTGKYPNFTEILHELLILLDFPKLDPSRKEHAVILANVGRFSSLLADYESSQRLGGAQRDWEKLIKGLCYFINYYATEAYEEQQPDDIRRVDAVQILTVHQAKGLEWPIVFIPALTNKRFPSSKTGSRRNWLLSRELFDADRYEGSVNDERKLFYVALTRARDVLCVSRFRKMKTRQPSSIFFDETQNVLKSLNETSPLPIFTIHTASHDEDIQTFSVSELLSYMKCPHFYLFRELWGYKPGLVEELGYGKSLHVCLKYVSELHADGNDLESALNRALEEKFHLPYAGSYLKEKLKESAYRSLKNFMEKYHDEISRIKEVEVRIEILMNQAILAGRVDVILEEDHSVKILDYKTSDEVTTYEQTALQLRLYAAALKEKGYPVSNAAIAYLDEPGLVDVPVNDNDIETAKNIAQSYIQNICTNPYSQEPNTSFCSSCDYQKICRWNN